MRTNTVRLAGKSLERNTFRKKIIISYDTNTKCGDPVIPNIKIENGGNFIKKANDNNYIEIS
ncbi:hypothetical protein [Clostridium sp. Marseille-Q7071]